VPFRVGGKDKLEVFPGLEDDLHFYWRRVRSHRLLSGGYEPFATKQSAVRAALRANPDKDATDVTILEWEEEEKLHNAGKR
jgi:hypothetical protein